MVKPESGQAATKAVSSTEGMQLSLETSELMNLGRLAHDLPSKHIAQMTDCLDRKDFSSLAELIMKESNQLHAICLDTMPPLNYMNSNTRRITAVVHRLNKEAGSENVAAYSVDAGFHILLFCLKKDEQRVRSAVE